MIFDSIMGLTRRIDLVSPLDRLWLAWNNEAQRIFSPKGSAVCQYEGRVGPTHRRVFRVASGPIVARSALMSQHWFAAERPSPSARERRNTQHR